MKPCTCHPSDNPPVPCAEKFAYTECMEHMRREVERITGIDRLPRERKRSTAEQMALEARLRGGLKRSAPQK